MGATKGVERAEFRFGGKPNLIRCGWVVKAVVGYGVTVGTLPVETLFWQLQGAALLGWRPFGSHSQGL